MTLPTTEPRRFSTGQRLALWLASDGRCQSCGCELPRGWHADHWQPYSTGGTTDVTNGQALCPQCNLRKGASMPAALPQWTEDLHVWQQRAVAAYAELNKVDFVLVASPGAGKTRVMFRIAHRLMQLGPTRGGTDFIIAVVPTDHLREQFAEAAYLLAGIELATDWTRDLPEATSDYHGIVVTYQQVARNPDLFRAICHRHTTLALLDEIHHAGDQLSWGTGTLTAFAPAARRVMSSGTLFRQDENPIPFVTYQDGRSVADFTFGYGEAVARGVCRPVLFPHHEGEMQWRHGDVMKSATFADKLSEEDRGRRLRTALEVGGGWLRHIIASANFDLLAIREQPGCERAGGMILAIDQGHAKRVARLLEEITGFTPTVVISEDNTSSQQIAAFRNGDSPWIVSVKMVSEGVDIPRLCVGVYASNVVTELFFRQVVGRFVRTSYGPADLMAIFYVPGDLRLVAFCLAVKEERDHALEELDNHARKLFEDYVSSGGGGEDTQTFTPLIATPGAEGFVFDGQGFDPDAAQEARRLCALAGLDKPEHVAIAMKLLRARGPVEAQNDRGSTASQNGPRPPSKNETRAALRDAGARSAKRLGQLLRDMIGAPSNDNSAYRRLNVKVIRRVGATVPKMTVEQLMERDNLLKQWTKYTLDLQRKGQGGAWIETWLDE